MKTNLWLAALLLTACASTSPRHPSGASEISAFSDTERVDIERLKREAFQRCQVPFRRPVTEPIPILDPPSNGGADAEGMVFQEELSVRTKNFLDRDGFYFSPRPRAAVNTLPVEIFVDTDGTGVFHRRTWDDANPDYTSSNIKPPIDKNAIPPAGRVLTELIIGHRSPEGDYPQLFDLRSSAYVRFAGYPPQITGASLRLGAHRIFSLGENDASVGEDFPIVRSMFASLRNPRTARAMLLVESDLFCGALDMDMTEGRNAEMLVDSYWYTREDFHWKKDRHSGLLAFSSMFWKRESSPGSGDAAHDTDTLTVNYTDGTQDKVRVDPPKTKLRIRDLTENSDRRPKQWILSNEDRDPAHYANFAPALGSTNYNYRASYKVDILESNIKLGVSLYEQATDAEYGDNIVALSTIRQSFHKAQNPDQFVHFKYRTTSFFPESAK